MLKLDGGMDVNGNGRRDNPPALSTDVFLGYEQMNFVDRQGPEKFAARDVDRNVIGSLGAETYWWNAASETFSSVNGSGDGAHSFPDDTADWAFHDPEQNNDQGEKQFKVAEGAATVWVKIGYRLDVNQARLYHVADGSNPEGAGGGGIGFDRGHSFRLLPLRCSGSHCRLVEGLRSPPFLGCAKVQDRRLARQERWRLSG